ncbi:MAG: FGGY family carbohydrate kinase [Acidobacteriota bacterium]
MGAILALDQGTTGSKAGVFAPSGRLLGLGRAPVATRFGREGRAVQDPAEILRTQQLAIRRALAAAGHPRITAAGISTQRSTFVVWDRRSGRPIGPAPTWQSTTAARVCADLKDHAEAVRQRTGLPLSPHYSASKLSRLLELRPNVRRRAEAGHLLFGNIATFLLWHLTKGEVHATDPTHAARTLLFNLEKLKWDRWLMDLFGVPPEMMPEVRPSLSEFGSIRVGGRNIPVHACLGDQQAALIGVTGLDGGRNPGTALVNYGTGAFVLIPTGSKPARRAGMLTSLAWTGPSRRCYLLEGTINAAGATLDWLRRNMGAPQSLEKIEQLCRESTGDTWLLPAFWGLGSAYSRVQDAILPTIALSTGPPSSLSDLTRAGVEAIAHMVAVVLERGTGTGRAVRRVVATGNLTPLRYLLEFQASLLPGVAVVTTMEAEASLAGIALAATSDAGGKRGRPPRMGASSRPIPTTLRSRRLAVHRHREWRRLIALARIWKEVAEAYS